MKEDKNDGLVSVIVPVYNVAEYVGKCIESLLNQSYKNLEILIVNDGSTDNSDEIVRTYVIKDERIRYIIKENGGLSSARNTGLDAASGEYICFVDSDDFVRSDYIEVAVSAMNQDSSDVVISNMSYVFSDGSVKSRTPHIENKEIVGSKEAIADMLIGNKFKCHAQNKICRSSVISDIRFPVGKLYEDVFTTYKLLLNANVISYVPEYTYYYLQSRPGSILFTKFNERRFDVIEAIQQLEQDILTLGLEKELVCFVCENVISLFNYICPIYGELERLVREEYISRLHACIDKYGIGRILRNNDIKLISKARIIMIRYCANLYCKVLTIVKRSGL